MKVYIGEYYEVAHTNNACKLAGRFDTLEDAIIARSENSVREQEAGYSHSKMIITRTVWRKEFDDDGTFFSYHETVIRVKEAE